MRALASSSRQSPVIPIAAGPTRSAVSAIIVNHNAGDLLVESVACALAQAEEVIVVDNDSKDHSLLGLENAFPGEARLLILRNERNLGFATACNQGMARASLPLLLFLNPDCLLAPGALACLVDGLQRSAAGMAGGLLVNPDGTEQRGARRVIPTPWRSFVRAFGLSCLGKRWPILFRDFNLHRQPLPDGPVEVEAISGALMLVRRTAVQGVGTWDEGYFLHCEDLDWCMRFRQRGWPIVFVPTARAVHHRGHCSRARPVFVEWHKHLGMMRFYRKFFRHQYPGLLMWLVELAVWLRFGLLSVYQSARLLARAWGGRA